MIAKVPHGHWKTTTFLAAFRSSGLSAPLVVDGAINGAVFRAYVEQQLAPTLSTGDIVIMDNLNSHKVKGVREAIEARGAHLVSCRRTVPTSIRLRPGRGLTPSNNEKRHLAGKNHREIPDLQRVA